MKDPPQTCLRHHLHCLWGLHKGSTGAAPAGGGKVSFSELKEENQTELLLVLSQLKWKIITACARLAVSSSTGAPLVALFVCFSLRN